MMLYEMTSQEVKTEFYLFNDVFASSSREEISVSEMLERRFLSSRGKPSKKPFFAIPNLSLKLQIDYSSSIYQFLEFKSETALTEESEQRRILEKVSKICDKLIHEETFFKNVDKPKLLRTMSEILNEILPEQLDVSEEELVERIRGVLTVELVSGTLNKLSPEDLKDFEESVKRRSLFNDICA